jgi:hypothetical protein
VEVEIGDETPACFACLFFQSAVTLDRLAVSLRGHSQNSLQGLRNFALARIGGDTDDATEIAAAYGVDDDEIAGSQGNAGGVKLIDLAALVKDDVDDIRHEW